MKKKKLIYWTPRFLAIIITAFFAIFIVEGFAPPFSWQDSLAHGVLAILVLGVTILAWKKPLVGGMVFMLFGLTRLPMFFQPAPLKLLLAALPIFLVPVITGGLFIREGWSESIKVINK